jgi:opacity protein-like surface antigen
MKNLLLVVTSFFILQSAIAQTEVKRRQVFFIEAGGVGYNISANYDMRFYKGRKDGAGLRVGVGYGQSKNQNLFGPSTFTRFTLPIELNYVADMKSDKWFTDFGIAYVPHIASESSASGLLHVFSPSLGVRYQKNEGLFFRIGYNNNIINEASGSGQFKFHFSHFAGVGLGISF